MWAAARGANAIQPTRTASAAAATTRKRNRPALVSPNCSTLVNSNISPDHDRGVFLAAGDVEEVVALWQIARQAHRGPAVADDRHAARVGVAVAGEAPAQPSVAGDKLDLA